MVRKVIQTVCKVGACEPYCGINAEVEGGKIVGVSPDRDHPLSAGYICTKGVNLLGYQNSPDRLLFPQKRTDGVLRRETWPQVTRDIGRRLRDIVDQHGPRAVATYWGNAADSLAITTANTFCHAFGSPNSYNVLSLEYSDRGVVADELYGDENLILQPDVTRSKFAILMGTNPMVTQGLTLLQRRPHVGRDLREAKANGGLLVVVDPRQTETTRLADLHLQIQPGTDLFLLLAMMNLILEEELFDRSFVETHTSGFAVLRDAVASMTPDRAAERTAIEASVIREVARGFAAADGAYISTRVGVQTSRNSTLTEWAVAALCALTRNIDRPGGLYYNRGVFDMPALIKRFTRSKNTSHSRIGGFPQIFGGLPCAVLPDEILTEGEGQVRALVVIAGNPVISFPNTRKVEAALRKLELLVVIDIFVNDTASFADYVLPAATGFEREVWHFLVDSFNQFPFAELRPKVVDPPGECRSEWDIFKDLSRAAGVPFLNNPLFDRAARVLDWMKIGFNPSLLYRYLLRGKKPSYRALKKCKRGARGHALRFGDFFDRDIRTPDRRLRLAPAPFRDELQRILGQRVSASSEFPFLLISGARRLASFNSWTHNVPELVEQLKGNWAILNERDARELGIGDGQRIRIRSECGAIEISARTTEKIKRGVVAVHQHWGHVYDCGMTTARKYPGVNVNNLHTDSERDRFCGMPLFNGTPVALEKLAPPARATAPASRDENRT